MRIRAFCLSLTTLAATIMVALAPPAAASTAYVWVGNTVDPMADHHSWSDARNWSPVGIPGDGDSVSISPPSPICSAHVDGVPAVTLVNLTITQPTGTCGVSVSGPGGPITVTGSFQWGSGQLAVPLTVAAGATATLAPNPGFLKVLSADMDVLGVLNLAGVIGNTALRIDNPRQLRIHAGAELRSLGTNEITFNACCVAPARVINDGTVRLSGGTLRITAVQFDQRNSLVAGTGATLITTKAPVTAASGARYSGGGSWTIGLQSIARFSGTQTLVAPFRLVLGGEPSAPGGRLGGVFTLAGTGRLDWTAGTIEGSMTVAHGMVVHAAGAAPALAPRKLNGRDYTAGAGTVSTVTNHGSVIFDGGAGLTTADRAHLINRSDGVLRIASGSRIVSMGCCVNPDRITNAGGSVIVTSSSASSAVLGWISYTSTSGRTTIPVGKRLELSGGAPGTLTSTIVAGGGRLLVAAPVRVSGTVTIGSGTQVILADRGSLDGTATLAGAGSLSWTGGAMSGVLTVSLTGGVSVVNTAVKYLRTVSGGAVPSRVRFTVPTTFHSGTAAIPNLLNLGPSTLTLAGATVVANQVQFSGGTLVNTGTLTINPGAGGKVGRPSGDLVNRGTVNVRSGTTTLWSAYRQAAGLTTVYPGAVVAGQISASQVVLSGGTLAGTGVLKLSVRHTGGYLQPGSTAIGTLRITGDYTQAAGGRVVFDLARSSRDRLTVDGRGAVAGIVLFRTVGSPVPPLGSSATLLTTRLGLTWSARCAYTSGPGSTVAHWTPKPGSRNLVATRVAGAKTHC
jgi:hypothetical protein